MRKNSGFYDLPMFYDRMRYVNFEINDICNGVVVSDRAYKQILCQTLAVCDESAVNGVETGGILIGHIVNGLWYIVESIDQGLKTINKRDLFSYDNDYANHVIKYLSKIYEYPLTILGIWHRHPGSLDRFSTTDEGTMRKNADNSRMGIISMLINIDPKIRMTFYYCSKDDRLMKVPYAVGDEYFIKELLEYRKVKDILANDGNGVGVIFPNGSKPENFVHSMAELDERKNGLSKQNVTPDKVVSDTREESTLSEAVQSEAIQSEAVSEIDANTKKIAMAKLLDEIVGSAHDTDKYIENSDKLISLAAIVLEMLVNERGKKDE